MQVIWSVCLRLWSVCYVSTLPLPSFWNAVNPQEIYSLLLLPATHFIGTTTRLSCLSWSDHPGASKCGARIGWKLVAWLVKGFAHGRTKETDIYWIHGKGVVGRTAKERLFERREWVRAAFIILLLYYFIYLYFRGFFLAFLFFPFFKSLI